MAMRLMRTSRNSGCAWNRHFLFVETTLGYRSVTFACKALQRGPIQNQDSSTALADGVICLQSLRDGGYAFAIHTEQRRDKFLRDL